MSINVLRRVLSVSLTNEKDKERTCFILSIRLKGTYVHSSLMIAVVVMWLLLALYIN